jgi:DNA-binding transcriptional ArsR family regulator
MSEPSNGNDRELHFADARAMRALAHPARVAILDHLFKHGPATATECADIVGESPSDCSFHLRTLAKWGFVEAMPVRGRNRPWRAVARHIRWAGGALADAEDSAASVLLLREWIRRDEQYLERYLQNQAIFPPEWQNAFAMASRTVSLTAAELSELTQRYRELVQEYAQRAGDPSREDARRVYLVFRGIPEVEDQP